MGGGVSYIKIYSKIFKIVKCETSLGNLFSVDQEEVRDWECGSTGLTGARLGGQCPSVTVRVCDFISYVLILNLGLEDVWQRAMLQFWYHHMHEACRLRT